MLLIGQETVNAQKTLKVYIVRHAEKLTDDLKEKDPELSQEGSERALALAKKLKGQQIDSIFATSFKRAKLTGFPLADQIGIAMKTYNQAETKALATQLIENAKGKNILIVGHSNTVLEIIEAFGGQKPVKQLSDNDYDYLFTLTIKEKKVNVKTSRYGESHHSEEGSKNEMKMIN
jgi:broad specificity phosphatase PhoE